MSDQLTDDFPRLWCGNIKALVGGIRVDDKLYRFMGPGSPSGLPMLSHKFQLKLPLPRPTTTSKTIKSPFKFVFLLLLYQPILISYPSPSPILLLKSHPLMARTIRSRSTMIKLLRWLLTPQVKLSPGPVNRLQKIMEPLS